MDEHEPTTTDEHEPTTMSEHEPTTEDEDEDEENPQNLFRKDPSTVYRQNLKERNRRKYEQYLAKQKGRSKEYREHVKNEPEKLARQRELAKLRQQKYRQKLKESAAANPSVPKSKPRTRAEADTQRKKWREAKQRYRQNMPSMKKLWIRRKEREKKREKYEKDSKNRSKSENVFKAKKTLYNITSKARQVLPEEADKFAHVMKNLVQNSTPRKRQATESLISPKPKIGKLTNFNDASVNTDETSQIKVQAKKQKSRTTKMKSKPSRSGIKYPKWYKISSRTERLATKFYFRPDISTPLPQKRYATKHGPGYIMSCTLAVAFSLFKKEHNEK